MNKIELYKCLNCDYSGGEIRKLRPPMDGIECYYDVKNKFKEIKIDNNHQKVIFTCELPVKVEND